MVNSNELTVDNEANAAFLEFAKGPVAKTLPVRDGEKVVATLSFL